MRKNLRIASLCPSNTELICALGLGHNLVAIDNYSDYPKDIVASLPRLGPDLQIDIDKLVSAQPDFILASLSVPGMEHVVAQVKETGIPYIVLSPEHLDDIFSDVASLADILHEYISPDMIQSAIGDWHNRIRRVQEASARRSSTPTIYWEWWPKPVFSPGRDNWLTQVSEYAGSTNLFNHVPGPQWRDETGDSVLSGEPDYMFAVWTGVLQHKVPLQKILNRPNWSAFSAFQQNALYILEEGLFCRPSPRLFDGLEQAFGLIHPRLAAEAGIAKPETFSPIRLQNGNWLR